MPAAVDAAVRRVAGHRDSTSTITCVILGLLDPGERLRDRPRHRCIASLISSIIVTHAGDRADLDQLPPARASRSRPCSTQLTKDRT
jgi:hypothetical protein